VLGPNTLTQKLTDTYLRYLFSAHPIGVHNGELEAALRAAFARSTYWLMAQYSSLIQRASPASVSIA